MNPKYTNDLLTLYTAMEKYDFKKEITVSVSIIESDEDEKNSDAHIDNRDDVDKSLEPVNINGSDQITTGSFQNLQNKYGLNNNNNNSDEQLNYNNDVILLECNRVEGQQNNSEIRISQTTDLVLPQGQIVNSRPTTVSNDSSSQELDILSKCIITILRSYNHFHNCIMNCKKNELLKKKKFNENYMYVKQRCFNPSRNIVTRTILPQGQHFDVIGFLHRTLYLARNRYNFYTKYKDIESVYNEILSSCYEKVYRAEAVQVSSLPANIQNDRQNPPLQKDVQNGRHYHSTTKTINNATIFQQNSQNNSNNSQSNLAQTLNNEMNTVSQENLRNTGNYSYEAQAASKEPDLICLQNSQNYGQPNNISYPMINGQYSAPRENLQNVGNYCNAGQTIIKEPSILMHQNSKHERHSNNIQQPINNEQSSSLQSLLKYDIYYNNGVYTRNAGQNSSLQPNQKNIGQLNSAINKMPSSIFQQDLENNRNYHNQQDNTVEQRLSQVPSTCVFQYKCPDYEVRLDVNNHILNNINKSNHINSLPTSDTSTTVQQYTLDNVRKTTQSIEQNIPITPIPHHDTSQIVQEPRRSISRDSGLMSPGNNLMNDTNNLSEDPTSPYITYVTSINPGASYFPIHRCYVCGEHTNKKCLGCSKYYYCSNKCQNQHWIRHLFDCTNNSSEIQS